MERDRELAAAIARVPGWAAATDLHCEPLPGGWTNRTCRVHGAGGTWVLRVANDAAALFGADRRQERSVVRDAVTGRLTPAPHYHGENGDMVTPWLPGRVWAPGDPVTATRIRRTAALVRRVHALPARETGYSPFRAIERCASEHRERGGEFPAAVRAALNAMPALERALDCDPTEARLCHHDLSVGNFIESDAQQLLLLDWEYAARGDPMFDYASVAIAHEYDADAQALWLRCLLGEPSDLQCERFSGMKRVYDLREATWSLLMRTLRGRDDPLAIELDASVAFFTERLEHGSP